MLNRKDISQFAKAYSLLMNLGIHIVVIIGGCGYIGALLDKKIETRPLLSIIGILIGLAAAYLSAYKMLKVFYERK